MTHTELKCPRLQVNWCQSSSLHLLAWEVALQRLHGGCGVGGGERGCEALSGNLSLNQCVLSCYSRAPVTPGPVNYVW